MSRRSSRRSVLVVASLVTAAGFSACGSDEDAATDETTAAVGTTPTDETSATIDTAPTDDTTTTDTESTTTTDGGDDADETIVVTAVDYAFEGLPETVPVGTKFSLANAGNEPHEFVAMLVPDEESRTVEELVQLPEEELGAVFGAGEPATVILAATGQTDVPGAVVGDGSLTEPGRYAIVCFLPAGSDDSILESDGPPPAGDAQPHALLGMIGDVTVEQ
jgi:plastocyanin